MSRRPDRDVEAHKAKLKAEHAAEYPSLAAGAKPAASRFSLITLGVTETGAPVRVDEIHRMAHTLLVGASGSGKSTAMLQLMQQDIGRGRGLLLLDPHGSDPESPFAEIQAWIEAMGFDKTGRVIVVDPNVREQVVGFNPLAPLPGTDFSVIADALLQAFQRAWGDEDMNAKPNIRTVLTATFVALAEKGLTIPDAKLIYERDDPHGVRARLIASLGDEFARDELQRLHELAGDPRSRGDYNAQVVGPINRLNLFVSAPAIRTMLGQTERTLDLLDAMDTGKIVLVNLNPGGALSEEKAKLLGTLLLRYLFLLAKQRRTREPFFLYVDECHQVLSGDVAALLAEARKYRVGVHLAHQFLWQLEEASELIYHAVMKTTRTKIVFAMEDPQEAQLMAEMVIPLDLETPVKASIRPTVVGQERVELRSRAQGKHVAESAGRVEATGEMEAHSIGAASADSSATGAASGSSELASQLSTPPLLLFGPNAPDASAFPVLLSQTAGTGLSRADTTSQAHSDISSESSTYARSASRGTSHTLTHGTSETEGSTEGFASIFADLPTSFHSLDNLRYLAGEQIRKLPVGTAFVYFQGNSARVTIPDPKTKPYG